MVNIFTDSKGTGEFVIQTTAIDTDSFILELSEAMTKVVSESSDGGLTCFGIMKNAMPIEFKLSGYKADSVSEQRTLVCGNISPSSCEVISSAGR